MTTRGAQSLSSYLGRKAMHVYDLTHSPGGFHVNDWTNRTFTADTVDCTQM